MSDEVSYEVVRRLGRGGMGVVDLARDPDGEEVALKRISLHGTPEELEVARQRIRREAEALRQLDHPAIVRLRDVVDDGDDLVLVMDHLPGGNLATRVATGGPLDPGAVQDIGSRLLAALSAAHRAGVVHRDVKPSNVLFDRDGRATLADFGAATHRDATIGLTAAQTVLGTPGFMSPEQARGEAATAASDVFSVAATLVFALTGEGPFGTADPRVLLLRAAAGRTVDLPRDIPADLRRTLEAMLDPDPERRPTAAAVAEGPAGTRVMRPPGDRSTRPRRRRPRTRRNAIAATATVVAALVGGGAAVLVGGDGDGGGPLAAAGARRATTTTAPPCVDLPYQPCGEDPAPDTDGRRCLADHADYDGDRTNGCEAGPDGNGDRMRLEGEVGGNIVPADDVDELVLVVDDRPQIFGDGQVHVTLTAPAGVSQRVTVLAGDGAEELGTAVSSDGEPATVSVGDPSFGHDDGTTLLVRIESFGSDRSAEPYVVTSRGSF